LTETTARSDAYLSWRARLAAKQEAHRSQEGPPKPTPNSMWDPASLFESKAPAPSPAGQSAVSPESIDLRTSPIDLTPDDQLSPLARAAEPSRQPRPSEVPSRRWDLVTALVRSKRPPVRERSPSIAEELRNLNEQRLDGTITEDEFKARKAELFA